MNRSSESGNAIFYIFVAIALLGALSFAVSRGGRGGVDKMQEDKAQLAATSLMNTVDSMQKAVQTMRLRDVAPTSLCFDSTEWGAASYTHAGCSDNANKVFHVDGGGTTWTKIPTEALDSSRSAQADYGIWHISAANEVEEIGTTCGADACADLLLMAGNIHRDVCIKVNDLMNVTNPSGVPPVDGDSDDTAFAGVYTWTKSLGDEAGSADLTGQRTGCFFDTAGTQYIFYGVLLGR
jgi:hypothetical protein